MQNLPVSLIEMHTHLLENAVQVVVSVVLDLDLPFIFLVIQDHAG